MCEAHVHTARVYSTRSQLLDSKVLRPAFAGLEVQVRIGSVEIR